MRTMVLAVALVLLGCADNAEEEVIAGEEVIEVAWHGGVVGEYEEFNHPSPPLQRGVDFELQKMFATVGEREWKKNSTGEWYFTVEARYTPYVRKGKPRNQKVEGSYTRYDLDDEGQLVILYTKSFFPTTKEGVKAVNAYMKLNPPKQK